MLKYFDFSSHTCWYGLQLQDNASNIFNFFLRESQESSGCIVVCLNELHGVLCELVDCFKY